jgi:hypothetical protein
MKLTIECRMPNKTWGHLYHEVSQAVSYGGDVIITFGNEGSVTLSSQEFDNYKNDAILFCVGEIKPNVDIFGNIDTNNMQQNDANLNRMFMSLVDSKYKVCNVAYRLSGNY